MAVTVLYDKKIFSDFLKQKRKEGYSKSYLDSIKSDFMDMQRVGKFLSFPPRFVIHDQEEFPGPGQYLFFIGVTTDDETGEIYGLAYLVMFGADTHVYYGGSSYMFMKEGRRARFITGMKDIARKASIKAGQNWVEIQDYMKEIESQFGG